MDGTVTPSTGNGLLTAKGLVIIGAAVVALISNLVSYVLRLPDRALLASAAALEHDAREFLDERDQLGAALVAQEALDRRRLALIDAGATMLDTCEIVLGINDLSLEEAIETTLNSARRSLITAIDFGREEYWAVSIFRRVGDELSRIVALRADPLDDKPAGRSWAKGEGYVGVAWARDGEVIIADGKQPEVAMAYPLPPAKSINGDADRYRSIAVVPIRPGAEGTFWGAVAVSSDCPGRFRSAPADTRSKNVDTVRLIGAVVEVLVTAFTREGT